MALVGIAVVECYIRKILKMPLVQLVKSFIELVYSAEKIGRNTSATMTVAYTTDPRTSVDA